MFGGGDSESSLAELSRRDATMSTGTAVTTGRRARQRGSISSGRLSERSWLRSAWFWYDRVLPGGDMRCLMRTAKSRTAVVAVVCWTSVAPVETLLAATLRVPSEYGTINAALDASAFGDTVVVAP